jgi:hypothetical protein
MRKFMNADESPAAVARLLALLENVEVQNFWQRDGLVHFQIRIGSIDSLGRIAQHAQFANLPTLTIHSAGTPAKHGEPVTLPQLQVSASNEPYDERPPSDLEIFGIFLARDLKALGRLPAGAADRLQRGWNAVVM